MEGLEWKTLLNWMIWGENPLFSETAIYITYSINLHHLQSHAGTGTSMLVDMVMLGTGRSYSGRRDWVSYLAEAEKVICWVSKIQAWLVVSNIFYFHPYLGKISNLTNIFQLGWNHQLETHTIHVCIFTYICLIWLANRRNQWMVCEEAGFIEGETKKQTDMQTNKHNQKICSTKKAGKKQNREGNTTKQKTNTGK